MYLRTLAIAFVAFVSTQFSEAQTEGMRPASIIDPVLQMPAWTVDVPGIWKVEGTMMPGTSCNGSTSPIVRASSPDGLTGFYLLPRTDWAWGAGRTQPDCQRFSDIASAGDYLINFARIRKLEVGRELPVPELAKSRRDLESINEQARGSMHFTTDRARRLVRYSVGKQLMEEWLTVDLNCNVKMVMGIGQQNECSAFVSRWYAPEGKLEARIPDFRAMKLNLNQQWMERWTAAMVQHNLDLTRGQTEALLQQGRLAEKQRMQQHQDFMANMQREGDVRKDKFEVDQYRITRNKENYVDYILDCQRAYGGGNRISVGNCPARETF